MDYAQQLKSVTRLSWIYLLVFLSSAFFLHAWGPAGAIAQIAMGFVAGFLVFLWVLYDSRVQSIRLSRRFRFGLAVFSGLFVPVYMVRSRGWKRGSWDLALFALKLFGCILLIGVLFSILIGFGVVASPPA